ncbi:hypothetical protein OIU84_004598 [Salix udensis]|uniref:Uncharacterized protein n=1 Tax=Salix udensis TaxID=889485 RepID=A0AAD6K2K2_9ROSI|nr:hypothetical protein OIU84_004598 [Salix udensis]
MHNKGGQACVLGQRESTAHKCTLSPPLLSSESGALPCHLLLPFSKGLQPAPKSLHLALTSSFSVALLWHLPFRSTDNSTRFMVDDVNRALDQLFTGRKVTYDAHFHVHDVETEKPQRQV